MAEVDVVIPMHNSAQWVGGALDSLLEQGPCLGQVICVDNNSTDNSSDVVQTWGQAHPNVRLKLIEERTPGACAARNAGLREVNTTWVQFLDSDDLLGPQKMASQMALGQDRDMVYGHFMFSREDHAWPSWTMSADPVSGLAHGRTGQTTSNLFRTESVRAAGGWDESLTSAQEYDLMFRMFKAGGRFAMSEDHLTTVRLFPEGRISTSNEANRRLNSFALRMKMWAHVQSAPGVTGAQKQRVLNALFNTTRWLDPFDGARAAEGYRALSEAGYSPTPDVQIPSWFVLASRMLGVQRAAKWRRVAQQWMPSKP
ncbi:MAG TPA: hypothetical protein DCL98_07705 [Flavobacteriales bacterium]|nr:hypothetical protein [Flavobacteriales bacterium]